MNSQNTNIITAPQQYCLEIKGSLELLQIIKQQLQGKMQKKEEKIDLSIRRRWCSLFMNLFLKHLKSKKQTQLLEQLKTYRKNMRSAQKKFEQGHVSDLLMDKTSYWGDFKIQWLEFLSSNQLEDSIKKNKRIQKEYQTKYIGLIDKVKEESNSEKPFYKFMRKNLDQMHNNEKNNGINLIDHQFDIDQISSTYNSFQTLEDLEDNIEYSCPPFQNRITND